MYLNRSKEIPLKAQLGTVGSRSMALTGAWKPKAAARPKLESHKKNPIIVSWWSCTFLSFRAITNYEHVGNTLKLPSFVQKHHESWIMNFKGTSLHNVFTTFASGSRLSSPFPVERRLHYGWSLWKLACRNTKRSLGNKSWEAQLSLPLAHRTPMSSMRSGLGLLRWREDGYTLCIHNSFFLF